MKGTSTAKKFLRNLYGKRSLNEIRRTRKFLQICRYNIGKSLYNLKAAKNNPYKYTKEFIRVNKINLFYSQRAWKSLRKKYPTLFNHNGEQMRLEL
jgi:hypothetical protein